tara:strand:- start:5543 stop:6247 length:705 start_codon:yes stop_codon:yes gene_type:complete
MENLLEQLLLARPLFSIITILWITGLMVFKDNIRNFFSGLVSSSKDYLRSDRSSAIAKHKKLVKHDVFQVIEIVRKECKIQNFYTDKSYDETKTRMFRDFMNFKLDSIRDHFILMVNESGKCESPQELKVLILKTMRYITEEYMLNTKNHFLSKGIKLKDANYVIDVFESWRLPTIKILGDRVNSIFSSDYHNNNYQRLLASLEIISVAIDLIPRDGVASFEEINGKFKKLKDY